MVGNRQVWSHLKRDTRRTLISKLLPVCSLITLVGEFIWPSNTLRTENMLARPWRSHRVRVTSWGCNR